MDKIRQRENQLLFLLKKSGSITVGDAVEALGVSEATVRRLFAALEEQQCLIRVHGGAKLAAQLEQSYSYRVSAAENVAEKEAIATRAAALVSSGEKIFIDSGTTTLRLAEALLRRLMTDNLKDIHVVTNSLIPLGRLADYSELVLCGGSVRSQRCDVCGGLTESNIARYRFDKAFLGVDGVSADGELMTTDEYTCRLAQTAISRSKEVYVLADSSKVFRDSFIAYAHLNEVSALITDSHDSRLGKFKCQLIN